MFEEDEEDEEEQTPQEDPRDGEFYQDQKEWNQPDPHGRWADFVYDPVKDKSRYFE